MVVADVLVMWYMCVYFVIAFEQPKACICCTK
jgi:hypothetical protein